MAYFRVLNELNYSAEVSARTVEREPKMREQPIFQSSNSASVISAQACLQQPSSITIPLSRTAPTWDGLREGSVIASMTPCGGHGWWGDALGRASGRRNTAVSGPRSFMVSLVLVRPP
jgi:hypothetical protein